MIRGLQLVCNREEAVKAHLQEKPDIFKLAYLWSHDESEDCEVNDEYVLDGLQPHPNLKKLVVVNYLRTRFPSWFSEVLLPNLVELKLSGCRKRKEIPSLGQLKLFRHLELIGFHELECIGPTFYGVEVNKNANIQVFPFLKELVLWNMPRLTEWKEMQLLSTGNDGRDRVGVRMFPGLEKLRISNCPLLKSIPNQFEMLRELSIHGNQILEFGIEVLLLKH
uniref:Putative ovule protein n=1 Tax=Solanum chacoense TaxID=4108 RepID=A0A0V0HZ28_SOLCH